MAAPQFKLHTTQAEKAKADFRAYLENSLRDPFSLNLHDCSLMEVIRICVNAKSKARPKYKVNVSSLMWNLSLLESQFHVTLATTQITDIFWGYFISFCQDRGMKSSSIRTMCGQLRSILNWAVKYNASVSPTYLDINFPKVSNQKIALTSDEVSRIAYFDIDRFYANRRADYRETMHRVRDMFVLSCNLFQRHSDMIRIDETCFERNIFSITQQKTGNRAVVNIDLYAVDAKTTYRILERYNYKPPYVATIGNYNRYLHDLMKDIGFVEDVRLDERIDGKLVTTVVPKWKLISSHTARRTAITINVLRGHNIHALKRCSGHTDLRVFDEYVRDE